MLMDFENQEELKAKSDLRRQKLVGSIERLMTNEDFRRFMGELMLVQSLEDCAPTQNGHMLAYMTGRRSVMAQIKISFFTHSQWFQLEEFDLNG